MQQQTPAPRSRSSTITDSEIEDRKKTVGLDLDDMVRMTADEYTDGFLRYLANLSETSALYTRREALDEARLREREHFMALVSGAYGRSLVEERIALGILYNKYRQETRNFLGGFHHLMETIGGDIMLHYRRAGEGISKFLGNEKNRHLRYQHLRRRSGRRAPAHDRF